MKNFPIKHLDSSSDTRKLSRGEFPLSHNTPVASHKELAEVMHYVPENNVYTVITRGVGGNPKQCNGRELKDIPRKVETPGVESPLAVGTVVIIDFSLGFPYIDGVLNINNQPDSTEELATALGNITGDAGITDTKNASTDKKGGYYRDLGVPADLLPGDKVITTVDGNRLAILRGGYNVLSAGPQTTTKLEQFATQDLTRLTSMNLETLTGFGISNFYNEEGRCGFTYKGGVDQLTESGGSEENWTFKVDVGDTGDYFTLEVCTANGHTLSKVQMHANGHVDLTATKGLDLINGGDSLSHQSYGGDLILQVLGAMIKKIEGTLKETVEGSRISNISESDKRVVGNNESTSINNHSNLTVGGNQDIKITGGSPMEAKPSNIAVNTQILNGSYFLELGNQMAGASPAAKAGFTVAVNNGDITLGQNPDMLAKPAMNATVSLNTKKMGSVALGGTTSMMSSNPAMYHAPIYEPLSDVIRLMLQLFDAHVHVPPIGGPPVALMTPAVSMLISRIMSKRVLIGG